MDAKKIAKELATGKAKLTWAVFQFNCPKLHKLQEDSNIQEFLELMRDEDPYVLRELPAISGVKQYIVMGRENKLPFMETGITEKQGNDVLESKVAREQLTVLEETFPLLRKTIRDGLEEAKHANCTSCVEKRVLQEVLQKVKDYEDEPTALANSGAVEEEPEMWGSREPCPLCTLKHLGQATVLFTESLTGYPVHRWIAVGHMAEAEAEAPSQEMANRIRAQRLECMDDLDYVPYFTDLIVELDAIVRG